MKAFKAIRKHFCPIQPAVRTDHRSIKYEEALPQNSIQDFVYCYWQLLTPDPLSAPFIYRVVSDGCVDIFFNHHDPRENFVMGFCRKYSEFAIGNNFHYAGIRFLPAAFPLLFGIDAKKISNQSQPLTGVLPVLSEWISANIQPRQSFEAICRLLNQKIEDSIQGKRIEYDSRFLEALQLILERKGHLDIEKEISTGLSPRQLRRIFNYNIGTTPKAFSDVVRFQYILQATRSHQNLKSDRIYYDVGFYDQAHFIKNFKRFYGVTPSEAFR